MSLVGGCSSLVVRLSGLIWRFANIFCFVCSGNIKKFERIFKKKKEKFLKKTFEFFLSFSTLTFSLIGGVERHINQASPHQYKTAMLAVLQGDVAV